MLGRGRSAALGVAALALTMVALPTPVSAKGGSSCDSRSNNTYQKLLECVTVDGVREHQAALQAIADNSDDPVYPGTRAAGTDGYADSVEYVAGLLRGAGYDVTWTRRDHVQLPGRVAAAHSDRCRLRDRCVHRQRLGDGAGCGDPRRHQPDAATASTSGCEAADFAGLDWSGDNDIALVQRGTCFFGTKASTPSRPAPRRSSSSTKATHPSARV